MLKEYTCIVCPNGCQITANVEGSKIVSINGATCPKGEAYVKQEITCPMRTIATSVPVKNGELPLASVRLTKPIPKEKIFDAMEVIRKIHLEAPVKMDFILVKGILNTDSDVIVTKNVKKA